ncbi:MAG: choice-of-anchor L domain-containing protein [Proteobacteria bacterium]|nr:choice-of-anchor L domain-containing protein [Pseudomonadota bacterium]
MRIYYPLLVASLFVSLSAAGCSSDLIPAFEDDSGSSGEDGQGKKTGKPGSSQPGDDGPCSEANCSATCCDGVCRDTKSNAKHCGECNHACADGEICEDGQCMSSSGLCPENEMLCTDECIPIVNNHDFCGDCDTVCGPDEVCMGRKCELDCKGLSHCGDSCADLLSSGENCGKCGEACPDGQACVNGMCSETCPNAAHVICDRTCVDLQNDSEHCGNCETECVEDEICTAGSCTGVCPTESDVICNHKCVNLQSDHDFCGNCGTACSAKARCVEGSCVESCDEENAVICDHVCKNVMSDPVNCGGCGVKCGEKEICQNGICGCPEDKPNCNEPDLVCENANETPCGDVCADLKVDRDNCGACGQSCGENGICQKGKCLDCTNKTPCEDGLCYDTLNDPKNCGGCGIVCPANIACKEGKCTSCLPDYVDCDGNPENGCEKTTADCACKNGEEKSCYYGPAGTEGKGACKGGKMTCTNNKWGACEGMVVPVNDFKCRNKESSAAKNDLNCDGKVDGTEDWDGDGVNICGGDCCDSKEHCPTVSEPAKVRPGFYEVASNKIDDNCNGQVDEGAATCSASYSYGSNLANESSRNNAGLQMAHAMDICDDASKMGYGLVSATVQSLSNPVGNADMGRAVNVFSKLPESGSIIKPKAGSSFAGISSGAFAGSGLSYSGSFISGGTIPSKYHAAHNYQLQSHPNCYSGNNINDAVELKLTLKAPINATGFQFDFRFFSYEYPNYVCTTFNDFFIVLLTSKASGIPADTNIAFDKNGAAVSVNNAFFTSCTPYTCYSVSSCRANYSSCSGGYCQTAYGACPDGIGDLAAFGGGSNNGGATAWLTTKAPVVGGETFTLEFIIWDTGDSALDSAAIMDNFRWITSGGSVSVGTDFTDPRT